MPVAAREDWWACSSYSSLTHFPFLPIVFTIIFCHCCFDVSCDLNDALGLTSIIFGCTVLLRLIFTVTFLAFFLRLFCPTLSGPG